MRSKMKDGRGRNRQTAKNWHNGGDREETASRRDQWQRKLDQPVKESDKKETKNTLSVHDAEEEEIGRKGIKITSVRRERNAKITSTLKKDLN